MIYLMLAALAMLAAAAFGARRTPSKEGDGGNILPSVDEPELLELDEKELMAIIDRVRVAEEPEPVMGAMCYEPIAMPQVAEYVCPACGEKTTYHGSVARLIEFDLPEARRLMGEITTVSNLELELDESQFCAACGSEADSLPEMVLRVRYEDGSEHASEVSVTDLRMLRGLLRGQLYYLTFNDAQRPLKPHLPHLRQLLGLPPEE